MARLWVITADSARPETISYMQRNGYPRMEPARKGPGSVKEGVEFLKSYDIVVHPRCKHTIDELTNYSYKKHPAHRPDPAGARGQEKPRDRLASVRGRARA
jgi:phage terminase large subunit